VSDQASFAAALLDPDLPCPSGLRVWNGSDPAARLAVYRNNVLGALSTALADNFPVVQELVGSAFFRAMACAYARQAPPGVPMLARYGAGFAEFISRFEPARSLPYLADVARLEFARVQAHDAADAAPLPAEAVALALNCGARSGELQLALHPSLAVLSSPWAVVSLWAAHQGVGNLATLDWAQPEEALVLRPALEVLVLRCPPGTACFANALAQGMSLGEAASRAGSVAGFDLSASLSMLVRHGALATIHLPSP
jgi:hypothetical protein